MAGLSEDINAAFTIDSTNGTRVILELTVENNQPNFI